MLIGLCSNVFAADADLLFGNDIFSTTNNVTNDASMGAGTANNTALNLQLEPANNVPTLNAPSLPVNNNNTSSSIPKAGESDIYVVTALIIISAIVTIYAYKKIRDYNSL